MKKFIITIFMLLFTLISCTMTPSNNQNGIVITDGENITINIDESYQLSVENKIDDSTDYIWKSLNDCVTVDENGVITGVSEGTALVNVSYNGYKDSIAVRVIDNREFNITISTSEPIIYVGESTLVDIEVEPLIPLTNVYLKIVEGFQYAVLVNNKLTAISSGSVKVVAEYKNFVSNTLTVEIIEEILTDPYENVTKEEFYANYTKASSSQDAYYRTLHGFMSGDISDQDQEPTLAEYQPRKNGKLVRNTSSLYSEDGNTYYIVDGYGNIVNQIYRGGGYVTLEEVAAYVLAFGDIPANYISKKSATPSTNVWGEYLRLNHSLFSGSTSKYPYEPELPNISGCGGDLYYYEIDLGTTGTDCDPSYAVVEYNNGYKITRGAARIVYSRYDANKDNIIDINEKYVFYTYNHYNDFQEYLNYEGGWGEMFGNITGGGTLSSKTDYNPTSYVEVERTNFVLTSSINIFLEVDIFRRKDSYFL